MICDNCEGRRICKFKEDCMIYERGLSSNFNSNNIFGAIMSCKEKRVENSMLTRSYDARSISVPCNEILLGSIPTPTIPAADITWIGSEGSTTTSNIELINEISKKLKK